MLTLRQQQILFLLLADHGAKAVRQGVAPPTPEMRALGERLNEWFKEHISDDPLKTSPDEVLHATVAGIAAIIEPDYLGWALDHGFVVSRFSEKLFETITESKLDHPTTGKYMLTDTVGDYLLVGDDLQDMLAQAYRHFTEEV